MAKHAGGRPSLYKPEYCKAIVDFFTVEPIKMVVMDTMTEYDQKGKIKKQSNRSKPMPNRLPTFFRFAESIDVNQDTLHAWKEKHPEFSEAFTRAGELQREFLVELGLSGVTPPASFIFVTSNVSDWRSRGVSLDDMPEGSFIVPVVVNRGDPTGMTPTKVKVKKSHAKDAARPKKAGNATS